MFSQSIDSVRLRPFVPISSHGLTLEWLYDTGADCSVMSLEKFVTIPHAQRPMQLPITCSLKSASRNSLKIQGLYSMSLSVLGKHIMAPVYVCANLNQNAILGMDAIERLGLTFNPRSRRFDFSVSALSVEQVARPLAVTSAVVLPPLSVTPVRVAVPGAHFPPHAPAALAIAVVSCETFPLLSGGPGLVSPSATGEVTVMVNNCSPCPAEVPRGTVLGFLDPAGGAATPVSSAGLLRHLSAIAKPRPPPLTAAGRAAFLADLKLQVPPAELSAYRQLFLENFDVFSKHKLDLGTANNFKHDIKLTVDNPVYIKQFRIPDAHRDALMEQVNEWLKMGIIQPAHSRFNSPIFVVPKKDGSMRFVLDFRALNANSQDDRYTMKDVNECIGEIGRAGSTIFSTLDLTAGFWQMPLDVASRPYTAFTIPGLGQFQWTRGAMGLKGCPGSFQRLVELAVEGVHNVIVYIDDLLVHSTSHQEHRKQLAHLFDRIRQSGLKLNLPKCEFGSQNVSYLGFRLTPQGIIPGLDKLKAVRDTPPPATVKEIRQFLGLCNFFRTHVRSFSQVSAPLTKLTCKDSGWVRGPLPKDALASFKALRQALISEPVVAYPRKDRPYALIVDASTGGDDTPGGMGAILCQQAPNGEFNAIAYASRGLVKHELNYTPFLAELMACVWGMKHFDVYLRGRQFTLYTDHRPLEKLGKVHTKTLNRLMEAMNEYNFTIEYKKGSEMPADYLSRQVLSEISVFDDDLREKQGSDPFCMALQIFLDSANLPPDPVMARVIRQVGASCFSENGIIWRRILRANNPPRAVLLLPQSLVPSVIQEAHGGLLTGHGGVSKTRERILQSYYWPGMDTDITAHLLACQRCQFARKDDRPRPNILHPLPQCSAPNQRIHADLFGPLRASDLGKKYVLCITDAFHKYSEILALPNKEAATVSNAIFNRWICRYGLPLEIVTDGGKEFCAKLANELYALLKIKHTTTSPYHPQCNAQAEVMNKFIAKYLARLVDNNTLDWELYLPPLMFAYNTSVHRTTKATPHFLSFGIEARMPHFPHSSSPHYGEALPAEWLQRLQLCRQLATQESLQSSGSYEDHHNRSAVPHTYQVGQLVLLNMQNFLGKNRKLADNWEGPYPIVKVFDSGVVDLQSPRRVLRVNVHRLKPYVSPLGVSRVLVPVPADTTLAAPGPPPAAGLSSVPLTQAGTGPVPQFLDPTAFPPLPAPSGPVPPPLPAAQVPPTQPPLPVGRPRGRPRRAEVSQPVPAEALAPRLTRAASRAMERAGLPPPLMAGLVNAVHAHVLQALAVRRVPHKLVGLPVSASQFLPRRRRWLSTLPPAARNLVLTGDPAFAFDPLVYQYVITTPFPQQPPLFQQQFGYLAPPAPAPPPPPPPPASPPSSAGSSPFGTPPRSPVASPPRSPVASPPPSPRRPSSSSSAPTPPPFDFADEYLEDDFLMHEEPPPDPPVFSDDSDSSLGLGSDPLFSPSPNPFSPPLGLSPDGPARQGGTPPPGPLMNFSSPLARPFNVFSPLASPDVRGPRVISPPSGGLINRSLLGPPLVSRFPITGQSPPLPPRMPVIRLPIHDSSPPPPKSPDNTASANSGFSSQVNPFAPSRCMPRSPTSTGAFPWPSGASAGGYALPSAPSEVPPAARALLRPSPSRPARGGRATRPPSRVSTRVSKPTARYLDHLPAPRKKKK